jgi:hypothetical protein
MRLIYQTNIGWQEFLGFYTGLNQTRKDYDEKFSEQRGIGEEIDDPQNSDGEGEENGQLSASEQASQYPRFSVAYRSMPAPHRASQQVAIDMQVPLLANDTHAEEQQHNVKINGSDASGLLEEDEERK